MHKTGFGHFLKFGTSDGLDIVYYDSTKCFPAFDNITRSWMIIQMSQNAFFNDSKSQKVFFGHFRDFGLLDWLDIT